MDGSQRDSREASALRKQEKACEAAVCQPRREALKETNPADTLMVDS